MLQYQIVQFILGANLNLLVIEETYMFRNVFVYLGANKLFYNSLHGRLPYKFGMISIDPFGYTPIQPLTQRASRLQLFILEVELILIIQCFGKRLCEILGISTPPLR